MASPAHGQPHGSHTEIRVEDLRRSFGSHRVLRGVDLTIESGEIVAIVGSSGCGKTVLLDHITGLMTPTSGRVLVADHNLRGAPLVDLAQIDSDRLDTIRLHWAVVFQKNALFTGTVLDNIALWLREHTELSEAKIQGRVRESLKAAALDVDSVINKDRDALSGGMAKRVAIARAIAVDPAVLFYDEPTTGLDPVVSGHIHELIWNVHHRPRETGKGRHGTARTTLMVTHDKDLLRRISPRVVMLDAGEVCFDGSYEEFSHSDACSARAYLEVMPVLHAREQDEGKRMARRA